MEKEEYLLAKKLGERLKEKGWMLATAESCTGGWVSQAITAVPGSSNWFERGFVTYSNLAKQEMLGVPAAVIEKHGAVSEEVVVAMAEGALKHSHAQVSVAVSGIAGPDADNTEKPVGLVWLAVKLPAGTVQTKKLNLKGDREHIREQSVLAALVWMDELLSSAS